MKRTSQTLAALLTLLGVTLALAGCGLLGSDRLGDQKRLLEQAEIRWAVYGPAEYSMTYQRGCFCLPAVVEPVRIEITGDVVQERRFIDSGETVPEDLAHLYLTVPEIFQEIRQAIQDRVHWLDAEYHPDLGYPVEVFIDPIAGVVDDEVSHRVLALDPN